MALRYWIPCNGNINNMGLGGNIVADSPVYSDSMFGKSISGGTLSIAAKDAASIMINKQFSVSMWVYIGASRGAAPGYNPIFFGIVSLYRLHSLFAYPTVNDLHYSYMTPDGDTHGAVIENVLPSNEWTNIVLTYDAPIIRIYINGELKATDSFECQFSTYNHLTPIYIHNDNLKNRANDIRVYDHCLSVKEVRLISQGLLFRQKLSRGDNPLQYNSLEYKSFGLNDLSGYGHEMSLEGTVTWQSNSPRSHGSVAFTGDGYFYTSNINMKSSACSYVFWAKISDWSAMETGKSYPVISFEGDLTEIKFVDGTLNVSIETDNSYYESSYDVSTLSSGWHLFTITYNGHEISIGADNGERAGTAFAEDDTVDTGLGNLQIGIDLDGNKADGLSLYDLRIYGTELSYDEISDIYNARIGVDNKGNIYAHDIEADEDNIVAFGNDGIIKSDLVESDNGFRVYKDHIEATSYQEL